MSKIHTVVSGDTLFSLSKKYGLTVNELKSINGLTSDTIKIGQILRVSHTTHTVVKGDTLFSLAKKYGTTVEKFKLLNDLKSNTIKVGQILKLPELYIGRFILKNEENNLFRNFTYEVKLSDGSICKGTSDNEGCTEVISSNEALTVQEIRIISDEISACCSHYAGEFAASGNSSDNSYAYQVLEKLTLIPVNPVNTVVFKVVRLETKPRNLTSGEIRGLKRIFDYSLNYHDIKVHKGKFFRYQNDGIAMTPMGDAYFPDKLYRDDFSDPSVPIGSWHLFIHEMVHVWQHQRKNGSAMAAGTIIGIQGGYTWDRAFPNRPIAYNYKHLLDKRTHLSEFNIEQQADIIADYFVYRSALGVIGDKLRWLLQDFVKNPKDEKLLPKTNDIYQTVWDDKK